MKLLKKLRCWIWGHIWYADGPSAEVICIECGKEF